MRWTSGLLERIDPAYRAIVKSSRVTKPIPFMPRAAKAPTRRSVAAGVAGLADRRLAHADRVDPATDEPEQ
jgi:hypothetical protein